LDYKKPKAVGGCSYCRKRRVQFLIDLYDILYYNREMVCPTCCVQKHTNEINSLLDSLNYLSHVGLEGT
jgi:hypothetical protein